MPWYLPFVRGIAAALVAVVITFSPDHSAQLGYVGFGAYALSAGAAQLGTALRGVPADRAMLTVQGAVLVLVGAVCLIMFAGGLPFLIWLASGTAIVTGALEIVAGLRRAGAIRRDRIWVGVLSLGLAAALLLVPPGMRLPTAGVDGSTGTLTASTMVVGLLGAYLAILGVYLVIAALSLKWADAPRSVVKA